uniref:Uncharacterized LOC100183195 n=1 Tax=Ciona intestinalis TaxID=7719 RepID=H2XKY5_CIOIN|nr:uncharacterized protein LOC100183195 [Ciona intestinalis]|eukprot:XP_002121259.1 uncharacterized protein LOC100183195 [Ciona intestinalis]
MYIIKLLLLCVFTVTTETTFYDKYEKRVYDLMVADERVYDDTHERFNENEVTGDRVWKRDIEPYSGGGGGSDLTQDQLTIAEILAIVICSVVGVGIFAFVGSCVWYKVHRTSSAQSFIQITTDADDSTLHMVDYDDIQIEHGKLNMKVSEGDIPSDHDV